MTARKPLSLHEEILLLALDDEKGTAALGAYYANAMAGAILAELAMAGLVTVGEGKKAVVTPGPRVAMPDDPILVEALGSVREAKKPRKAADWVGRFARIKDLKNRAARRLVTRGVLAEETDQVLVFFRRTVFPERDGGPERELRGRLEAAVFTDTADVAPRTAVVVALLKAANMLDKVLGKGRVKERKARIEALTRGDVAGRATREAVQAMQAALVCCAVMPAVIATTTTTTT